MCTKRATDSFPNSYHVWSHFVKRCRRATFVQKTKAGLCQEAAQWVGSELTEGRGTFAWRAEARPLSVPRLLFSLYWIKYESGGLFSRACYLFLIIWRRKSRVVSDLGRGWCEFSRAPQLSLFVLSCLISPPCKVFWESLTVRKNVLHSRWSSTRFFTCHPHISQQACADIFINLALVREVFFLPRPAKTLQSWPWETCMCTVTSVHYSGHERWLALYEVMLESWPPFK